MREFLNVPKAPGSQFLLVIQFFSGNISCSRSLSPISPFVIRKSVSSQDNPENIGDTDHADTEYGDTEREVFIVKSEENLIDTSINTNYAQ